jgi:hypothetical protein
VIAYQVAETTLATAAIAVVAGALVPARRLDGWLVFNVPSAIIGYALYAWAAGAMATTPAFRRWGALPFAIQFLLVWTLYPWLWEHIATRRRRFFS